MSTFRVEAARISDLPGAYRTALQTADAGEDGSALLRDPDLVGHVYVGPYIVRGSGTQLVLVDDAGVAGHLLSADDTLDLEAWAEASWWPPLRARYAPIEDGSRDAELIRYIHEPPRALPEVVGEFPAHLHIDLQERARGRGLGRLLVGRLLDELRARAVEGVHLVVDDANTNAIGFYAHVGFAEVRRDEDGVLMGLRLRG